MMRWSRALRLVCVMAALCVALCVALGLALAPGVPVARASSEPPLGPCSPLTSSDLAQPEVTAKGNATAMLSRTEGTLGTLLTLSGGGRPANTPVGIDVWVDHSGQFKSTPLQVPNGSGGIDSLQATTSASGALQFPAFRMSFSCGTQMAANGHKVDSVTLLFVVHTLDGSYLLANYRQPIQFTFVAPPTYVSVRHTTTPLQQVHVGDTMTLFVGGWAPGERLMVTPQEETWPSVTGWWPGFAAPAMVPSSTDDFSVTANGEGVSTFSYTIPQVAPLTYIALLVHGEDASYGDIGLYSGTTYVVMPDALPGFRLDHNTVAPGGAVTVTGFGWQPGQQGVIEYCRGVKWDGSGKLDCIAAASQSLGTFQADSSGAFVAHVGLPINARLGQITLQARVNDADLTMRDYQVAAALGWVLPMTLALPAPQQQTQAQPWRVWLIGAAPYLGGVLLAALMSLFAFARRRRNGALGRGDAEVDITTLA